jgi:hypothetical protein
MRPEGILQSNLGWPVRHHPRRKPVRIHDADRRRPDQIDALVRKFGGVRGPGPRVGGEVFMRGELRRVNEDRHDHPGGVPAGEAHQREVSCVQRTHGGDQGDARGCELSGRPVECLQGTDHLRPAHGLPV